MAKWWLVRHTRIDHPKSQTLPLCSGETQTAQAPTLTSLIAFPAKVAICVNRQALHINASQSIAKYVKQTEAGSRTAVCCRDVLSMKSQMLLTYASKAPDNKNIKCRCGMHLD